MDPVLVQGLRDMKSLLDDGILTQDEFNAEKARLLKARRLCEQGSSVAQTKPGLGVPGTIMASVVSPPPLHSAGLDADAIAVSDVSSPDLYSTHDGLFKMAGRDAVQVMDDLKAMQDIIRAFKNSAAPEAYCDWSANKSFKDITLAAPGAFLSMKTHLIGRLNSWLEEVTPQLRADGDDYRLRMARKEVNDEIDHIYVTGARMRAHFNRLPKGLQHKMQNGEVKSFEHIYDFIACAEFER